MVGVVSVGRSHPQITFPLTFDVRAAEPSQSYEHAQDAVDGTAADSGKPMRTAHWTVV